MSVAPAIIAPRAAWLAERRATLGASDVAAVLGEDPYRGALAVYASKVGEVDAEETKWMRWGRLVEGAIAEGYSEETGRPIVDMGAHEIQRHRDVRFLSATLDRVTSGSPAHPDPDGKHFGFVQPLGGPGAGPLECKAVAGFKAKDWREDPPLHFQIQLQAQLACTGASWGSLVALIGGLALAWRDMQRDEAFLAAAMPRLERFWWHVENRQPPDADGLPGTAEAIRQLFPGQTGETVALDEEAGGLLEELEAARAEKSAWERAERLASNRLRVRLGEASFGALLDGSFVKRALVSRKPYQVEATSYYTLSRFRPKVRRSRSS